jgi:hypothetical protein
VSGGHRGPGPEDRALFREDRLPTLRVAVHELSWLLSRGYADRSALELVGNRHGLVERQRLAVSRCACTDGARADRTARRRALDELRDQTVHIDGFNAIIVCESVLGGAPVLVGRDGAHRDLASVHGTWRRVSVTTEAIERMGELLATAGPREVVVWLDRPVSNSGRLAGMLRELASSRGWPWQVELAWDPDRELLAQRGGIVASADARILDGPSPWVDVPGALATSTPTAWRVDLST